MAADGIPRGIAGRSQTVDVYASTAITSGGFRLTYGDEGVVSPCIAAKESELSASSISSALVSANALLNVTVEEDDPPYDGVRRFVVYFNEPELGVARLAVAEPEDACEWLMCSDGEDGECEDSGVEIDRDASILLQEGAIEVDNIPYLGSFTLCCAASNVFSPHKIERSWP